MKELRYHVLSIVLLKSHKIYSFINCWDQGFWSLNPSSPLFSLEQKTDSNLSILMPVTHDVSYFPLEVWLGHVIKSWPMRSKRVLSIKFLEKLFKWNWSSGEGSFCQFIYLLFLACNAGMMTGTPAAILIYEDKNHA